MKRIGLRLNSSFLDVGPDYTGRLRGIDVQTLGKVGQYFRGELKLPPVPLSPGK